MDIVAPRPISADISLKSRGDVRVTYAAWLWLLLGLFVLRVAGQVLVAFFSVRFLPPMEEWYSGLLSYPMLLPVQLLIIVLFSAICVDVSRGRGRFASARHAVSSPLMWFGRIYFASMVARYAISMALYPERRWLHGAIPIVFHLVLASYLMVLARYYAVASRTRSE